MRTRLSRHRAASTSLASVGDEELRAMVDAATPLGSGIGGESSVLDVDGTPVFLKSVALTDLELRHFGSTANLYDLPEFFHYGIGSPGLSAWRELAAHTITTQWVLQGESEAFPLLYHSRVLEGAPRARLDEGAGPDFWGGSAEVRARFDGLVRASHRIVLFLEYVPQSLHAWLEARAVRGDIATALPWVEEQLLAGAAVMSEHELLHFDAHFRNILTDGERLYFSDFGLATSAQFELTSRERQFVFETRTHDEAYVRHWLAIWLLTAFTGATANAGRDELMRRCARGDELPGVPTDVAEIIRRHARVSLVLGEFYRRLRIESRTTPYPFDAVTAAMSH